MRQTTPHAARTMGKKHTNKVGAFMNPRSFKIAVLMSLALAGVSPAAMAQAQTATVAESGFAVEVAAARAAMMGDPETALRHARAAIAISQANTDATARPIEEATGAWLEAEALMRVNRPQEARPAIGHGLAIAVEHAPNTKLHADLLRSRAALSMLTGEISAAHADLLAAREIFRTLSETRSQAIVLQNLGSLHSQARDFERALAYYEESRQVHSGDLSLTVSAHNNRGNALKELGRFDEAEREFGLALAAAREMNSELLQARILSNLASAQTLRGNHADAEASVELGLALAQRSADRLGALSLGRPRPDRAGPQRPSDRPGLYRTDLLGRRSRQLDDDLSRVPRDGPPDLFRPRRRGQRVPAHHRFPPPRRSGHPHRRLDERGAGDRPVHDGEPFPLIRLPPARRRQLRRPPPPSLT